MNSPLRLAIAIGLLGASLLACSGSDKAAAPTPSGKGGSTSCTPNQTVFCRCGPEAGKAAGEGAYQTCSRDGKGFGVCGPCTAEDIIDPPPTQVACGNNVREGSEECDDGNQIDTDGCTHLCMYAICGDGFVQAGKEECDDGNDDSTDGCTIACKKAGAGGGGSGGGSGNACDGAGTECKTDLLGECRKGTLTCTNGTLACTTTTKPAATDTCGNGLDDDCNGKVDDNACACPHDMCDEGVGLPFGCVFSAGKATNAECHAAVCAQDDYCCNNQWDDTCVKGVQLFCGRVSCEASKGACTHTLCTPGDALVPDCDKGNGTAAVKSCVKQICDVDPACCETAWDQACIDRVINVCGKKCDKLRASPRLLGSATEAGSCTAHPAAITLATQRGARRLHAARNGPVATSARNSEEPTVMPSPKQPTNNRPSTSVTPSGSCTRSALTAATVRASRVSTSSPYNERDRRPRTKARKIRFGASTLPAAIPLKFNTHAATKSLQPAPSSQALISNSPNKSVR
jgi:cysteine-rich repeat protein